MAGKWKDRNDPPKRKATRSRAKDPAAVTPRRDCMACKGKSEIVRRNCPACKGEGHIDLRTM